MDCIAKYPVDGNKRTRVNLYDDFHPSVVDAMENAIATVDAALARRGLERLPTELYRYREVKKVVKWNGIEYN